MAGQQVLHSVAYIFVIIFNNIIKTYIATYVTHKLMSQEDHSGYTDGIRTLETGGYEV